jgi:hypothetical protein
LLNEFVAGPDAPEVAGDDAGRHAGGQRAGYDIVRRAGHIQNAVAVQGQLSYPVQDVRWTVREQ